MQKVRERSYTHYISLLLTGVSHILKGSVAHACLLLLNARKQLSRIGPVSYDIVHYRERILVVVVVVAFLLHPYHYTATNVVTCPGTAHCVTIWIQQLMTNPGLGQHDGCNMIGVILKKRDPPQPVHSSGSVTVGKQTQLAG